MEDRVDHTRLPPKGVEGEELKVRSSSPKDLLARRVESRQASAGLQGTLPFSLAVKELQRTLLFSLAGKEEFREPRTKRTARTRRNRLCELSRFSRISRLKTYSDLQRTLPFLNPEDSRRHLLRGKGFSRKGVTPLRTPGTPPLSGSRLAWRIRSLPGVWRNPPESGRSA